MAYRSEQKTITKDEAFELVQKKYNKEFSIRHFVEMKKSWIFVIMAPDGGVLIGAAPVVVDKSSGRVFMSKEAWVEFVDKINWRQKILRWWFRGRIY